jgi:hypothetical protein
LHDPQLALTPWMELAGRAANDAAVLEARIALPYAQAELGAYGNALQGYQAAADGFEVETQALNESIAAIRAGKLVEGLIAQNPGTGLASFASIARLPAMPHAGHLAPLLAGNAFQEAYKNLRDLQFLEGNLQQWLDSLDTFTDMLDNRRRAYAERLPAVRAHAGAADIARLQQQRDKLAAEMARAGERADALAWADPHERELLLRMGRALGTLARIGEEVDLSEAGDRLRRVAAALSWQRAQEVTVRSWEARKALRAADAALAAARQRDAALELAQREEPARHEQFAARITELTRRLQVLAPQVAAIGREQQEQLQDIAVAELQRQQERLDVYAAQARLAIAQIHDRAQFARRGDTEPAPPGAPVELAR